jgi:hypothetical protein
VRFLSLGWHCSYFAQVVDIERFMWMCSTEYTVCLSICPPHTFSCSSGPSWAVFLLALLFAEAGGGFTGFTVISNGVVPFCVSHIKSPHVYTNIFLCFTCIYMVLHFMPRKFCCDCPRNVAIYLWLCSPLLDHGRFFSLLILYTVGRTPWTGDQPVARPLLSAE